MNTLISLLYKNLICFAYKKDNVLNASDTIGNIYFSSIFVY